MNWTDFAKRRIWRIYPTYVCALLLTAVVDFGLWKAFQVQEPGQVNSVWAFTISMLGMQGYFSPFFGSNGVFWTLAMELHLYAAYPILYYLSRKFGPGYVLAITFAVSCLYIGLEQLFHFESMLPYRSHRGPVFLPFWFTWTIGFYIAEIESGRARKPPLLNSTLALFAALGSSVLLSLSGLDVLAELAWSVEVVS